MLADEADPRWITQDRFHDPGKGTKGNCYQACIASWLGLPLSEVPNFIELGNAMYPAARAFLRDKGYCLLELPKNRAPDVLYMASGPAARGVYHCVLMKGGDLVWDTHPSRAGLLSVEEVYVLTPYDPMRLSL